MRRWSLEVCLRSWSFRCCCGCLILAWHQVGAKTTSVCLDWVEVGLPGLQLAFGIVQNVASFRSMCKWLSNVTWHHGSIVKQVKKSAAVLGEDDLLLSPFDGGSKMEVISFLELLTGLSNVSTGLYNRVPKNIRCW